MRIDMRVLFILLVCSVAGARHLPELAYSSQLRAGSAPVAVLPDDREVDIGARVVISGERSSDLENDALVYSWGFDVLPEGSNAHISNISRERIAFVPDIAGHYIVKLVLSDGASNSAPAYMSIRVREKNMAPQVGEVTHYHASEGFPRKVIISSWARDMDGKIVAYEYDFGDGHTSYHTHEESPDLYLTHYYESVGIYTTKVTAIDDKGGRSSRSSEMTINNNLFPRPTFSASVVVNPDNPNAYDVNLDATMASDPDGSIAKYRWYIGNNDHSYTFYDNTTPTQVHTILATKKGEYEVYLDVVDNQGLIKSSYGTLYVGIDVPAGGGAPLSVYTIKPRVGSFPLTVEFDARSSFDLEGDSFEVYWLFGDFGSVQFGAKGKRVSHTYKWPGSYSGRMMLRDAQGNLRMHYFDIHVKSSGAVSGQKTGANIFAGVEDDPLSIALDYGRPVGSLDNVPTANYFWDFGDGVRKRGDYQSHRYEREGTYRIKLATVDINGLRKTTTKLVTVRKDRGVPHSRFSSSIGEARMVTFNHGFSQAATEAPLKFSYFVGDSTPRIANVSTPEITHAYPGHGLFKAHLFVEEEGRTGFYSEDISIVTGEGEQCSPSTLQCRSDDGDGPLDG